MILTHTLLNIGYGGGAGGGGALIIEAASVNYKSSTVDVNGGDRGADGGMNTKRYGFVGSDGRVFLVSDFQLFVQALKSCHYKHFHFLLIEYASLTI